MGNIFSLIDCTMRIKKAIYYRILEEQGNIFK